MKQCFRCKKFKNEKEFHKNKAKKDGIDIYCKECICKYGKKYRGINKEALALKRKEYIFNHKKDKSEYDKEYYKKNEELKKIYAKEYRETNRDAVLKVISNWGKNNKVLKSIIDKKWKESPALYETYINKLFYVEQVRNNNGLLELHCAYCNKWFVPKNKAAQQRVKSLEGKGTGECRLYCSEECKKACPTYRQQKYEKGTKLTTSREVPADFRKIALEDRNYTCERCNSTEDGLHVHHIEGYTELPMLMADLSNVIVVCKKCHKEIHKQKGCNYQDYQCANKKEDST